MPESPKSNAQLVQELREKFFAGYDPNTDCYHEDDIKRIRENEWYCKRFILHQRKNVGNALEMLKEALKWRKEFGVNDLKETDFPKEFYELAGIFPYTKDKQGNVLLIFRVKLHQKIGVVLPEVRKFLAFWIEKVDRETNGSGVSVLFDLNGAGMSNVDLDLLRFLINCFKYYYPKGLGHIYVNDMPWIFNAIWKMVKGWLPAEATQIIKFVNKKSITEYIELDNLPDYMGGTSTQEYVLVPKDCVSILEGNLWTKLTEDQMRKFIEVIYENKKKLIETINEEDFEISEEEAKACIPIGPSVPESQRDIYIRLRILRMQSDLLTAKMNDKPEESIFHLLQISPNNVVQFPVPSSATSGSGTVLTIQNISGSSVAFKVQSNNLRSYRVFPSAGVIESNATAKVDVQLLPGHISESKDKFLLSALRLDYTEITPIEIQKLWHLKQQSIVQLKLRCEMEGPLPPSLVASMADSPPCPPAPLPVSRNTHATGFSNGVAGSSTKELEMKMMAHSVRERGQNKGPK